MNREEKQVWIRTLKEDLARSSGLVLVRHTGLDAEQTFAFRQSVRKAGSFYKVVKNTLAGIVFKGTPLEPLCKYLTGPLGLVYGPSVLDVAKAAVQYADKNDNMQVVAGVMADQILDLGAVKQLATLPDLDTLRGKLVAVIQAPARRVLGVVQAPAGQLARVMGAYGASGH